MVVLYERIITAMALSPLSPSPSPKNQEFKKQKQTKPKNNDDEQKQPQAALSQPLLVVDTRRQRPHG